MQFWGRNKGRHWILGQDHCPPLAIGVCTRLGVRRKFFDNDNTPSVAIGPGSSCRRHSCPASINVRRIGLLWKSLIGWTVIAIRSGYRFASRNGNGSLRRLSWQPPSVFVAQYRYCRGPALAKIPAGLVSRDALPFGATPAGNRPNGGFAPKRGIAARRSAAQWARE